VVASTLGCLARNGDLMGRSGTITWPVVSASLVYLLLAAAAVGIGLHWGWKLAADAAVWARSGQVQHRQKCGVLRRPLAESDRAGEHHHHHPCR